MKTCNIHWGWYWKASKLKETHLYNTHWRERFPAGTTTPTRPTTRAQEGPTAGTNPLASDSHPEPTAKCNARTAHSCHTPSSPLISVVRKQSRIHPLSGAEPERCTGAERVTGCACSRLSIHGMRLGGGAGSRSHWDSINQHGYAAVYQQPAARSLFLLFIFK